MKKNKVILKELKELILKYPKMYQIMIKTKGNKKHKTPSRIHIYNYIMNFTKFLNKYNFNFTINTRVWYALNNITKIRKCKKCGKEILRNVADVFHPHLEYCCKKCQITSNEFYKDRMETWMKNLGVDSPSKSKSVLDKQRITSIKKYGVKYPMQNKKISNKSVNKRKLIYGCDNWVNQKKAKDTWKNKSINDIRKIVRNRQKNYLLKTGYKNPGQNPNVIRKQHLPYFYNNRYFKNSWELSYYIYLLDNNINFTYQPNIYFEYKSVIDNKTRHYIPDFIVNGEIVEIKGDQFFKDRDITKEMINPYDKTHETDYIYEEKHKCMLKNNIKILTFINIKPILNYIKIKYGTNYLKQFKKSVNKIK